MNIKNGIEVSVIVLTYNQRNTIVRTLDSILAQKCSFQYEIVIGEDASTDDTREVCERYKEKYGDKIVLVANEVNKGIVDNYFDCFDMCRGRFVADCAGDDFWADELKLQKEYDIISSDDEIALVHTAWNYYDEISGKKSRFLAAKGCEWPSGKVVGRNVLAELLSNKLSVHLCTAMYRKSVLNDFLNNQTDVIRRKDFMCEDLPIVMALASVGCFYYIDDVTLNYSVSHSSISHEANVGRRVAYLMATIIMKISLADAYGIDRQSLKSDLAIRLHAAMMASLRLRDWPLMEQISSLAIEKHIDVLWKSRVINLLRGSHIGRRVLCFLFK